MQNEGGMDGGLLLTYNPWVGDSMMKQQKNLQQMPSYKKFIYTFSVFLLEEWGDIVDWLCQTVNDSKFYIL